MLNLLPKKWYIVSCVILRSTILPDFSQPRRWTDLHTVLIRRRVPDSPFEYPPCNSEPKFCLLNVMFSQTFKQASAWSSNLTRKCRAQENSLTIPKDCC